MRRKTNYFIQPLFVDYAKGNKVTKKWGNKRHEMDSFPQVIDYVKSIHLTPQYYQSHLSLMNALPLGHVATTRAKSAGNAPSRI